MYFQFLNSNSNSKSQYVELKSCMKKDMKMCIEYLITVKME
jgi:hypothetical protein